MEAPKVIFADWPEDCTGTMSRKKRRDEDDTKYIRADLVDRLKGYKINHKPDCESLIHRGIADKLTCTCGLTELLGEMG